MVQKIVVTFEGAFSARHCRALLQPPTFAAVNRALLEEQAALDGLRLYHSTDPLSDKGNHFTAYAIRLRRMDSVRLGYVKTFITKPRANHVMMAYQIGAHSGSCDDGEHNAGSQLLHLLKSKNLRNVTIYVVCEDQGQQIGSKRFDLIMQVAEELLDFLLVNSVVADDGPPLVDDLCNLHSSQNPNASDG